VTNFLNFKFQSGQVYTFGCNDEGALGRDTSEEGSEFEPGLVELPGKAVFISAGDSHSAALLEDGRVFIWGNFRVITNNYFLTILAFLFPIYSFQIKPIQLFAV